MKLKPTNFNRQKKNQTQQRFQKVFIILIKFSSILIKYNII